MQITLLPELEEEREKLRISMAQAERGELMDEAEVRRRMQAMKAEWAAQQSS